MCRLLARPGVLTIVVVAVLSFSYAAGQSVSPTRVRIAPVEERELTAEHREMLGLDSARPGRTLHLYRVCVRTPELCRAWVPSSKYFATSTLSLRDRELLILRTCWLTKNEYTWGNHIPAAKRAGLSDADILRVTSGPQAKGWSSFDVALLEAADALHSEQIIPEPTWKALAERYNERELTDVIFIVGQYTFVSMWARSAGFPLEPGVATFPR